MSDNLQKYSFTDLIKEVGKIRIPKIQRDYAQGRKHSKIEEIRTEFVHELLSVTRGKLPSLELDFVYGSKLDDAFEPLDGQQRLTTLFLLHWLLGVELTSSDGRHSVFTYETRNTSTEFCDELVLHPAERLIGDALSREASLSAIIKQRDWFKWSWRADPTIQSMLVMIDELYNGMIDAFQQDLGDLSSYRNNLEHITFNLLDLEDFGMQDELFVKMNARGKQLSDFDKLKSTLEEELQLQQTEKDAQGIPLASKEDETTWRTLMDGAWIDFLWIKYAQAPCTEGVRVEHIEIQFKKLLIRLIALQLLVQEETPEELKRVAYNMDDPQLDRLLFVYRQSRTQHSVRIDFRQLINDINSLIYKGNDEAYRDISNLLPWGTHIEPEVRSLFDSFLVQKIAKDKIVIFYAMLLFLRTFPAPKTKEAESASIAWYFDEEAQSGWLKNFADWVRSTRNILLNDNNDNRIDSLEKTLNALKGVQELTNDFAEFVRHQRLDLKTDKDTLKKFLISSDKTYIGLDNSSLKEERDKAGLILNNPDNDWASALEETENHPYLWGQLRCLLCWSAGKYEDFIDYHKRLVAFLNFLEVDNTNLGYAALLVARPYYWLENGYQDRLYVYNKERDNSFKRYLRTISDTYGNVIDGGVRHLNSFSDEKGEDIPLYGASFKALLALWRTPEYQQITSIEEFLSAVCSDYKGEHGVWISCIIEDPSILNEAWHKRIYGLEPVTLMQKITKGSRCYDVLFVYLRNLCRKYGIPENMYKLYDSKSELGHAFQFTEFRLTRPEEQKIYYIEMDNSPAVSYDAPKMLEFMRNKIEEYATNMPSPNNSPAE